MKNSPRFARCALPLLLSVSLLGALAIAPASPALGAVVGKAPGAVKTATTSLTPASNRSGVLPSGYSSLTFTLGDGDWTERVTLPASPANGDTVTIVQNATYATTIDGKNLDFGVDITAAKGSRYTFTYSAAFGAWTATSDSTARLSPSTTGATIPNNPKQWTTYTMEDGDWVNAVTLPAQAAKGSLILIRSTATWDSSINSANLLYASTRTVKQGDTYVLRFDVNEEAGTSKWVIVNAPTRTVAAGPTVPTPTSPRTLMTLTNATTVPTVTLPASRSDRDRVTIHSDAATPTKIVVSPLAASGPLLVGNGQEYTFLYVAEKSSWVVLASPDTSYTLQSLPGGQLPALTTPRTIVTATDGSTELVLPADQPAGSRVILKTTATAPITVRTGGTPITVNKDETVAFVVNADKSWKRETVTIDYLLLYSSKAATKYGAAVMQQRIKDGFALTNEALENSGANFRLRAVGLREFASPSSWSTLDDVVDGIPTNSAAQTLLNQTKADALYYEGTETGCGLAYVNTTPDKANMVATTNSECGITAMRHEIGHNMGLDHGSTTGTDPNRGYVFIQDIMGGNTLPYFSTPNRFDPLTGLPYGITGKIDSVKTMNALSAAVAAFR